MFLHVTDVCYEGEYRLRLIFNDGTDRLVDLKEELDGPVFEPLRELAFFRQVVVNNDTGTIEWPNGADYAPEFLHKIGVPVETADSRTLRVAEGNAKYGNKP
jgi:hypothetical protein